jgi:chorismate synthase
MGGRHDACIALRAPVVVEAAAAAVLADLLMLEGLLPRIMP